MPNEMILICTKGLVSCSNQLNGVVYMKFLWHLCTIHGRFLNRSRYTQSGSVRVQKQDVYNYLLTYNFGRVDMVHCYNRDQIERF